MDPTTCRELLALLRCAIRGTSLTEDEKKRLSWEQWPLLFSLAERHDLAHLLSWSWKENQLPQNENDTSSLENSILRAVYRYELLQAEYQTVCQTLEEENIPFLPLKGSVLRRFYPQGWMRTSCDIDILVKEEQAEKAAEELVSRCGYRYQKKGSHDISLFSPSRMHIELHYSLLEEGIAKESSKVLSSVWDSATVQQGSRCLFEMSDEMFYFYHIAHMAKHFEIGGCGIRPFLDLWILDHLPQENRAPRDELLRRGKLLLFAQAARNLSKVWLENAPADSISQQMEDYILRGGVYGNRKNRILVQQQKEGGALSYALSRIFLPYDVIKFQYPVLQKHPYLTPVMQVRRWGRLLFRGKAKRSVKELQYSNAISADEAKKTKAFLESIGLKEE